jgi:alpha-D-glucose phosphate-specific phosphoglucomutase
MASIRFGTDGWRAIIARDFTYANLRIVAQGIASYINSGSGLGKSVVIGFDNRFMSSEFAQECASILAGNGIKVHLLKNSAPTPLVAFAVRHLQCDGGIVITASHNPAYYNGVKFIPAYAGPATPEETQAIESEIQRVAEGAKVYEIDLKDAVHLDLIDEIEMEKAYFNHLDKIVQRDYIKAAHVKVVIDPMYGAGIGFLENYLTGLGIEVKAIHSHRDVLFGNTVPEPVERNLSDLRRAVISYNAGIGLALDGDADRFGLVDHEGRFISGNQFISLLLHHLLATRTVRGPVVRTVATTRLLDRIAQMNGLQVIETPVGFKYVSQALREYNGLLGGEESGGVSVWGHVPEKDGILACILAVEMMAYSGKTFSELIEQLYRDYGQLVNRRQDIRFSPGRETQLRERLSAFRPRTIAGLKVLSISDQAGMRWELADNSWLLARFSDTEPLLRIYTESPDLTTMEAIEKEICEALEIDY